MELELKIKPRGKSRVRNEKLGITPDQSGTYSLGDKSAMHVDASEVRPGGKWTTKIQITPAEGLERKYAKGSRLDLTDGVEVYLNEEGQGRIRLSQTKTLLVRLDKPIAILGSPNAIPLIEENYPDYPGERMDDEQLHKLVEVGAIRYYKSPREELEIELRQVEEIREWLEIQERRLASDRVQLESQAINLGTMNQYIVLRPDEV